jgi:hypothetical protein
MTGRFIKQHFPPGNHQYFTTPAYKKHKVIPPGKRYIETLTEHSTECIAYLSTRTGEFIINYTLVHQKRIVKT